MSFHVKKSRLCTDCATPVLPPLAPDASEYRRVHFRLHSPIGPDPNTTFCTFCKDCAEREWPRERLDALQALLRKSWEDALSNAGQSTPVQGQMLGWYQTMEVVSVDDRYPTMTWPEVQ